MSSSRRFNLRVFPLLAIQSLSVLAGDTLDLSGPWRLRLDAEDKGVNANWSATPLVSNDRITLPNTTDRAGFGFPLDTNTMLHAAPFPVTTRFPGVKEPVCADEHGYLVRRHLFVGPAWYEREIEIPKSWKDRRVNLRIERAMWQTEVWVDGRPAGACDSLVAEHLHELGVLAPGRHRLTIRVDNRLIHNLSTVTHAYGPETQSRWNGMIGAIQLEAVNAFSLDSLQVFPAPDRRSVRVALRLSNTGTAAASGLLKLRVLSEGAGRLLAESATQLQCAPGAAVHEAALQLREPTRAWDEFHPIRYRLEATLQPEHEPRAETRVWFGFRHVERMGKALRLNDRPLFLRGTLDCAVYPKTGHPPTTVGEWKRVLEAVKNHGFNHVRFHTWCPPQAAFEAADQLGLYLQPEAPAWVDDWGIGTITKPPGIGRDQPITEFLRAELQRMSEAYGNHPSFLLCTIGNEFGEQATDWDQVSRLVEEIRRFDSRRLYSGCTARRHLEADDFWVTHNTGASTRGVGPGYTDWDFAKAVAASPVPVIAHETGQRPVFPDYDKLLPKFTGPLLPLNLERYRRKMLANGLGDQMKDFARASAQFQLAQYKAEHEAMLRTPGYAGYQLLMLNDFTGQSEALVGMLDPFWESKRVVAAEDVRSWNAPIVALARFPKYVWGSDEVFSAKLEVAHFGESDLRASPVQWSLRNQAGRAIAEGRFEANPLRAGGVYALGSISVSLNRIQQPEALTLSVRVAGAENQWPLWAYPAAATEPEPADVRVTNTLDDAAVRTLENGGKVLLLAHGARNPHATRTEFESVYWSAGWWGNKFSSLGVLCDPKHPALAQFPNAGHSDWQWRDLCNGATTFDLTDVPAGFRPVVQPVPDFHFNTFLAHVFEARVGQGSLLVTGYDLANDLERRPAAKQFRRSLFRYAGSTAFRPTTELPLPWIESRCGITGLRRLGAKVFYVSSEDRANGHVAANLLDGDPATFWHTRWQPQSDPMPHELVIDLGRVMPLLGITYLPRQDQSNGRIARADVFASADQNVWAAPLAELHGQDSHQLETLRFNEPVNARYLRVLVKQELNNQPLAAIAELDVIPATAQKN
jgi:hypothetical protein